VVLLLSAENFFGIAITLPFRKLLLAIRYSPIAAVSRLADLPISRFADKFGSAGASPSRVFGSAGALPSRNGKFSCSGKQPFNFEPSRQPPITWRIPNYIPHNWVTEDAILI
jgi:hypothetical protein